MKLKPIAGAALLAFMAIASPVLAQHRGESHEHGGRFYGRSFHEFSPYDLSIWRGGRWLHSWHGGVYGWWWFVDDGWYAYPEPIYPYPAYVPGTEGYGPPPPPPGSAGPAPSQLWYHCDAPDGYYPYVKTCKGPWTPVPATPPQTLAYRPAPDSGAAPPPPQPPYQPGTPR